MKRVKAFLTAVCLVVVMVSLSSVAFAYEIVPDGYAMLYCPECRFFCYFRIDSYKQATSVSPGFVRTSCPYCNFKIDRITKYWSSVDSAFENFSSVGYFDIVSFFCNTSKEFELGTVFRLPRLPTCTEAGWLGFYHLGNCGSSAYDIDIPALDHAYVEISSTSATCTTPGSILSTCSRCSETKTESISIIPHTWAEIGRTPATCLPGSIEYICSICNQTKTEPISADPTAHAWTETSRTPATCLPGSIEYTCSICQETKMESIPARDNAHTYEIAEIIPAEYDSDCNLVASSYIRYACSACGSSYNSTIGGSISGPVIDEGAGGSGMMDSTAALGKTFLSGIWALFGIYVPGFNFTFGQMWFGVLLASISILVVRMIFGFGGGPRGEAPRTSSTNHAKISKERRHDEF